MNIDFAKLSPGGNETLIVRSEVPISMQPEVSTELMTKEYLMSEQVGFLSENEEDCDGCLQMMGGELCVNALRSSGALLSIESSKSTLTLTSSGTDKYISCKCREIAEKMIYSEIQFPLSIIQVEEIADGVSMVFLEGITFILVRIAACVRTECALKIFNAMEKQYRSILDGRGAFGVIPYWKEDDAYAIAPVVYVRKTDTLTPETGCGSGSIALALVLDDSTATVRQPSGALYDVRVEKSFNSVIANLASPVQLLLSGTAYLPAWEEDGIGVNRNRLLSTRCREEFWCD
jgi:histidine racemase